jgi:hypothetical protein
MKRRSKKLHWIKYYPSDWQAEPTLRTCSLASKGLWIEMLGLMAHSVRHGYPEGRDRVMNLTHSLLYRVGGRRGGDQDKSPSAF